jgi:hypothetical protein
LNALWHCSAQRVRTVEANRTSPSAFPGAYP